MSILIFEHEGYVVATSSWSAAARPGSGATLCYEWGPDRSSWFGNAVSTARTQVGLSMPQLAVAMRGGTSLDLRGGAMRKLPAEPAGTLLLEHEGWEVATTSWTAAALPGKPVSLCYEWGADRTAWTDNAVSTARVKLTVGMEDFLRALCSGPILDIRPGPQAQSVSSPGPRR